MAHTVRSKKETKEFFDPPDELNRKVEQLAQLVKNSKHFIVFTVRHLIYSFTISLSSRELVLALLLEVSVSSPDPSSSARF